MFVEALADNTMESFFPLVEQFRCAVANAVVDRSIALANLREEKSRAILHSCLESCSLLAVLY